MEENTDKLWGNLFGTIDLQSEDHLELILSTMTKDQSIFFMVEAIKHAYRKGVYTIGESEVISKSIRTVSNSNK